MEAYRSEEILQKYLKWWDGHTLQVGQIHDRFLTLRQAGLRHLADSIEVQVKSSRASFAGQVRPLLTLEDLNEFATGSVVKCLGQEYAVYAGRRSPRIPNGELLLMSRITSIRGRKGVFDQVSGIVAEYDVPSDGWFFDGDPRGRLPYSICIEIALQPCGLLSAYLGTPLRFPEIDYYFRNLDGEAEFHRLLDARGKTINAQAELLKTIFYGSTIIQHYSFKLSCGGEVFFEGKSSFGYFSADAMMGQVGLDGGKIVLPRLKQSGQGYQITPIEANALKTILPNGKLRLIDGVVLNNGAGDFQEGYVYAHRRNSPHDWFYACHFHEDPVMPGSLGIEAIIQAMKVYANQETNNTLASDIVTGQKMNWSYRGQVLQTTQQMQVEVHFHKPRRLGKMNQFVGDASLWADDSRIYEIRNMSIAIEKKQD